MLEVICGAVVTSVAILPLMERRVVEAFPGVAIERVNAAWAAKDTALVIAHVLGVIFLLEHAPCGLLVCGVRVRVDGSG